MDVYWTVTEDHLRLARCVCSRSCCSVQLQNAVDRWCDAISHTNPSNGSKYRKTLLIAADDPYGTSDRPSRFINQHLTGCVCLHLYHQLDAYSLRTDDCIDLVGLISFPPPRFPRFTFRNILYG